MITKPNDEDDRKPRGRATVSREGPGLHLASGLGRGTSIHFHVLILAMLRRVLVQWGCDPATIEGELAGEGRRSHVGMVGEAATRVGVRRRPMHELERDELRQIAEFLAARVSPNSEAFPAYPDGWRDDLEAIGRLSIAAMQPEPEPEHQREPGED
jgi:hypothetical protein